MLIISISMLILVYGMLGTVLLPLVYADDRASYLEGLLDNAFRMSNLGLSEQDIMAELDSIKAEEERLEMERLAEQERLKQLSEQELMDELEAELKETLRRQEQDRLEAERLETERILNITKQLVIDARNNAAHYEPVVSIYDTGCIPCPGYSNLTLLDNSYAPVSGIIQNGIRYQDIDITNEVDTYRTMHHVNSFNLYIIVDPSVNIMAAFPYIVIDDIPGPFIPDIDILEETYVDNYVIARQDYYIDNLCERAVIDADVWEEHILYVIQALRSNCDYISHDERLGITNSTYITPYEPFTEAVGFEYKFMEQLQINAEKCKVLCLGDNNG